MAKYNTTTYFECLPKINECYDKILYYSYHPIKNIPMVVKEYIKSNDDRLIREKTLLNKYNMNNHIVKKIDEGFNYICMEFINKQDLQMVTKMETNFSETVTKHFVYQILIGLASIHGDDRIHGDISLENILIDTDNNIKICDFEFSVSVGTIIKGYAGKLNYMPPEMTDDSLLIAHPSIDLYAIGVLIFTLQLGDYPYKNKIDEHYHFILKDDTKGLFANYTNIFSSDCIDLLSNLLCTKNKRYESIAQLLRHKWFTGNNKILCKNK